MARTARIVLDLALGSMTKICPVVSQAWDYAKIQVSKTRARVLMCNPVVNKIEDKAKVLTDIMIAKMTTLRNKQLPKEVEYLQRQLEIVKQKMEETGTAAKNLKSASATSWQYIKVEAAPPMTVGLLNGAPGKNLENIAAKISNGVIQAIEGQIKAMDLAAEQLIKQKEAEMKALIEKQKAEEKKKLEEKKAAALAAAKKAAEEAKKAAEASKAKEAAEKKPDPKAKGKKSESKPTTAKKSETKEINTK